MRWTKDLFIVLGLVLALLAVGEAALVHKGVTFVSGKYCPNVTFGERDAELSLIEISRTGANYVAIVVTWYQDWSNTTDIYPLYDPVYSSYYTYLTEKDEDLEKIIKFAHSLGLAVMMKPHIDLTKDPDPLHWRGHIGVNMTENQWPLWFDSYRKFALHYASMSHRLGVEVFSISCELIEASKRTKEWRGIIKAVREVYNGYITDSANWGEEEESKLWWDDVDFIGIDAYYPIDPNNTKASVKELVKIWEKTYVPKFENMSKFWNKPISFTEIGYCSGDCKRGHQTDKSLQAFQARRYEAALLALKDKDWFMGFFWWAWNSDFAFGGKDDNCISPQWKKSEHILRKYYHAVKPRLPRPKNEPKCMCTV